MIRPANPIMLLAEQPASQTRQTSVSVSGFDVAFLFTVGLFIVGGCFFMLDLAAARSSGQESSVWNFLTETSTWLPTAAMSAGKYVLLLVASAINSALIVLLVQSLRVLDRKVRHVSHRIRHAAPAQVSPNSRAGSDREYPTASRDSSGAFLLSPVFR